MSESGSTQGSGFRFRHAGKYLLVFALATVTMGARRCEHRGDDCDEADASAYCPARGCEYNGQHYEIGEAWNDGCNDCGCQKDGTVVCTLKLCVDAGVPAETCGGLQGIPCPEGQYCNYPVEALCGAADATGVCADVPDVCAEIFQPVCGCDDETYGNACEAARAGVSVASEGECGSSAAGCHFGATEFPVGTGIICPDGCNRCQCEGDDRWLSTLIACEPKLIAASDEPGESTQGLSITPLYLAENSLALSVQYGGGCFEHTFQLYYSPAFAESDPVQARLWLVDQTTEPDTCLALPVQEVVFDLSPLRDQYKAQYPNGTPKVLLNLGREQLEYTFQ